MKYLAKLIGIFIVVVAINVAAYKNMEIEYYIFAVMWFTLIAVMVLTNQK